jgi:hypothetical protein
MVSSDMGVIKNSDYVTACQRTAVAVITDINGEFHDKTQRDLSEFPKVHTGDWRCALH